MATLAALLKHRGFDVSGSDAQVYPPMSDFLRREGIAIRDGYAPEHVAGPLDLVIVGNAISRGNVELEAVLDRKLRYTSLPEAIRDHFLWEARSVVIAGTHGKTTTTALTGWLLVDGGTDPTVFVGGIANNLGEEGSSYRVGRGGVFVIEGDEYDSAYFDKTAKFLKYLPDIAVVGNVEFDHGDIYADLDEVRLAFRRFVNLVPRQGLTLLGIDSPDAAALAAGVRSRLQTFGLSAGADWRASEVRAQADESARRRSLMPIRAAAGQAWTEFHLHHSGTDLGLFSMPLVGDHNVRNALAAIAIGVDLGVGIESLRASLSTFKGVKRRMEVVGTRRAVTVYDDFAHHPTAVAETVAALRRANPAHRIWAVFEPRSASSCRRVFQADYARAFRGADEVVLAPVFRSSLPESERLSETELVADLLRSGIHARMLPGVEAIVETIAAEARAGDLIVVMSNGGFGGIQQKLLTALERQDASSEPPASPTRERMRANGEQRTANGE
jgi:UDP-N-acetylmuramate: L-alanyl-gamma-D-glutamyl-meso-diaminopimelate ligase